MGKRDKDDTLEDYKKLTDEIIIEKVNEIFRSLPDNYIAALEEIGFKFHGEEDDEDIEERSAKPNVAVELPFLGAEIAFSIFSRQKPSATQPPYGRGLR
jgi:hypothetical protein